MGGCKYKIYNMTSHFVNLYLQPPCKFKIYHITFIYICRITNDLSEFSKNRGLYEDISKRMEDDKVNL